MGTMIYQKGVFINACYDELCLNRPDLITEIHKEYFEAGAQVLESNSYGANRIKLSEFGLEDKVEAINKKAVELAKSVAGDTAYVAGAMG
jgi:homocysteine S-methyltransferase